MERNDGANSLPWEVMEVFFGLEHIHVECGSIPPSRAWAQAVLADAEKERQEGIQGNWQLEVPFKEELETGKDTRKSSRKRASTVYGQYKSEGILREG